MNQNDKIVFIVGSPRSGTTLLENLLNYHPRIAEWYEPYYLWESFFPASDSDEWDISFLNDRVISKIQTEFHIFRKKSGKSIIVDKSPYHSFNLRIILKIFPEAKFIHIIRDGRDVTLSIQKEWEKRSDIIINKDLLAFIKITVNMLKRQPFWRYRLIAVIYELTARSRAVLNFGSFLNKSRWKGEPGWGPRFKGWYSFLQNHTSLEFNARQWVESVEAVMTNWEEIPRKNRIEIRYEDLILSPQKILTQIFDFIEVELPFNFFETLPRINQINFNKWQAELSPNEIKTIRPILAPLIETLGYAEKYPW